MAYFQMEGQELTITQQLERYKQRDLHKTQYFRMAQKCFGPAKLRVRRFNAAPLNSASTRSIHIKTIQKAMKQQIEKGEKELLEVESQEREDEYTKWMRERKKMRRDLTSIEALKYWLENKMSLTEIETYVLERILEQEERRRAERAKLASAMMDVEPQRRAKVSITTPLILRPSPKAIMLLQQHLNKNRLRLLDFFKITDKEKRWKLSKSNLQDVIMKAHIPISDLELDDMVDTLGKAGDILYKDLAHGQKTWKKEVRQEVRNQLYQSDRGFPSIILTTSYLTLISNRCPEKPCTAVPYINTSIEPYPLVKLSNNLQVPPIDLSERRPFTAEELRLFQQWKLGSDKLLKENKEYQEKVQICQFKTGIDQAVACHSLLSSLKGPDGEATNEFRQRCLTEYYRLQQVLKEYNILLTEGLLERAVLHPGDKTLPGVGKKYRLRQPGTNLFNIKEINDWFTARERTLMDQLDQAEMETEIEIDKDVSEEQKKTLLSEQDDTDTQKEEEQTKIGKQVTKIGKQVTKKGKQNTETKQIESKVKPK
uniref:Uncharacterized protein n=2 Tax=Callorhinchus milii TaxID=7868 RepID=A0A4W3K1N6_CALMI